MFIYTHIYVDLDAIASVWAIRKFYPGALNAPVLFQSAEWDGNGASDDDIIVDIRAKGRGIKGEVDEDGTTHSAFVTIMRKFAPTTVQLALDPLMRYIDLQDAHGNILWQLTKSLPKHERDMINITSINGTLRALREVHQHDDQTIVSRISEIFDGLLISAMNQGSQKEEALKKAEFVGGGEVAILTHNLRDKLPKGPLFERGVKLVVYVNGNSIGVVRRDDIKLACDHPFIREVVEKSGEMSEWFAHDNGFLFCRGSLKAPVDTPSKVNPRELAQACVRACEEYRLSKQAIAC